MSALWVVEELTPKGTWIPGAYTASTRERARELRARYRVPERSRIVAYVRKRKAGR